MPRKRILLRSTDLPKQELTIARRDEKEEEDQARRDEKDVTDMANVEGEAASDRLGENFRR